MWFTDGVLRGIVIGAAAISGPWLAFLAVISYSGALARRRAAVRRAAHAWMATNIGMLLLWTGLVINNLVR